MEAHAFRVSTLAGIAITALVASSHALAREEDPRVELPLQFIENCGQWAPSSRFVARSGAVLAAFEDGAIALHLLGETPTTVRLVFEGASRPSLPTGEGTAGGHYNFYIGDDRARWRSCVPAWTRVRYRGLYPGIDLVVRDGGGRLEYDLELQPGADLSLVTVRAEGVSFLEAEPDGALVLHTAAGPLLQSAPRSWEVLAGGERRPLESGVRLGGSDDLRCFDFEAPHRDPSLAMVVDPGLEWSTFLGGGNRDQIQSLALATDGSGDVIVCGHTWSPDFPATSGALIVSPLIPFVARLDASGSTLIYATLFGSSNGNVAFAWDLALDATSAPVVVGETNAADFPTTAGAFQTSFNEPSAPINRGWDAYVTRFDASGGQMVFSTDLGAAPIFHETQVGAKRGGDEAGLAVAVDSAGSVIVAGRTTSEDFPTTAGAYDRTLDFINVQVSVGDNAGIATSRTDAFVSRLNATGTQLTYSTFVGGQADDLVSELLLDPQGIVTLVGVDAPIETFDAQNNRTQHGTPFPTTPDALRRAHLGASDIFVCRLALNGAGSADFRYGTLFGGNYIDDATDAAIDPTLPERITLSGTTRSWDFPTTPGAWSRAPLFLTDGSPYYAGVLATFRFPAAGGGSLIWSTLVEGTIGAQIVQSVTVDPSGDVEAVVTDEGGLHATQRAYKPLPATGIFVARFSSDGRELRYGTFLHRGSTLFSDSLELASAGPNAVVLSGQTLQTSFPTTPGAFDRLFGNDGTSDSFSTFDGFVAKLTLEAGATEDTTAAAPTLLSPANGAALPIPSEITPLTLDWSDVTDSSGVQLYEVQVGPNPEFLPGFGTRRGGSVTESTWSTTAAVEEVLYWRVRTLDGVNNFSPWSAIRSFTLGAPAWTNFSAAALVPNGVVGGSSVQGKVYVQNRALAGGQVYTLTSSNPAVATVPASTTVPAGSNVATFVVSTHPVAVPTPVQITVWSEGNGDHPVLWVDPAPPGVVLVSSLALAPASVVGGSPSQGTVTLSGAAPAGGAMVMLTSANSTVAAVPAAVTVPDGLLSASFPITTTQVAVSTSVAITAAYGGATRTATLGVTSPPVPTAPTLLSPANDARPAQPITFDWSDVSLAASYTIQVDDSSSFTTPLVRSETATVSQFTTTGLATRRHWWRVRALNSVGVAGPWSAVRRLQPQAAPSSPTLSSLGVDPTSVVGGNASQSAVTLTSGAPSGGAVIALSSSNGAVASVPPSVVISAGVTSIAFNATTSPVTANTSVIISATWNGVTRTATLTVTPAGSGTLPAPSLVSPANDGRFPPGSAITFDWTDVAGAATYTIQIDDSDAFTSPLVLSQTVTGSQCTPGTLPTTRMWWRARAHNGAGSAGAWSAARRFELRN